MSPYALPAELTRWNSSLQDLHRRTKGSKGIVMISWAPHLLDSMSPPCKHVLSVSVTGVAL